MSRIPVKPPIVVVVVAAAAAVCVNLNVYSISFILQSSRLIAQHGLRVFLC